MKLIQSMWTTLQKKNTLNEKHSYVKHRYLGIAFLLLKVNKQMTRINKKMLCSHPFVVWELVLSSLHFHK